jgi:very-short-patch-repair endonuclease
MPEKSLITQQTVKPAKLARAQELRHAMTPAERELWKHLRANRLEGFHFRRQQVIEPFIVDFYCHAALLVVEVDGGIHLEQVEYDAERDLCLQELGLYVLHFTNLDVGHRMDIVLGEILRVCQERTQPGDLPQSPP